MYFQCCSSRRRRAAPAVYGIFVRRLKGCRASKNITMTEFVVLSSRCTRLVGVGKKKKKKKKLVSTSHSSRGRDFAVKKRADTKTLSRPTRKSDRHDNDITSGESYRINIAIQHRCRRPRATLTAAPRRRIIRVSVGCDRLVAAPRHRTKFEF